MSTKHPSTIIGWREWVSIPDLSRHPIKVKVDTGARTSALHAENVVIRKKGRRQVVEFTILPHQETRKDRVTCVAELIEMRHVKSSTGHVTQRPVVVVEIQLGGRKWPIELTLVNRDIMGFRMLLGRQALCDEGFLVDPGASFLQERKYSRKVN